MRLDVALTEAGLAQSRARARALVEAGVVRVDGAVARRAAQSVSADAAIEVLEDPCPWVSRGALKLIHALDAFQLDPKGARALDLGASTGGFTEVLLARGAREVVAVDVGRGQLAPKLRADPRVRAMEATHARDLTPAAIGGAVDWLVIDLSFIALAKALPWAAPLAAPGARMAALIKPQFELSRADIGKGGVVRAPEARTRAVARVEAALATLGWRTQPAIESPIRGGDGNIEFLIAAEAPA